MEKDLILTIDIGASKIRFMVVGKDKESVEYLNAPQIDLVGRRLNNMELVRILSNNIRVFIDNTKKERDTIKSISIGSPGPVNQAEGIIETPPNLKGIRNLAIVDELKKIFNLPVFLLNDADAASLGEWWLREYKSYKNIVYLTLSTGVGSGVIKNGRLETSEFGHRMNIIDGERMCSCGELNHAEAYLGTRGLAETYSKIFEVNLSDIKPEEQYSISRKMRRGVMDNDPRWLSVQAKYAEHLAILLRNILDYHQLEIIILGGGIIFGNEPLLTETNKRLKEIASPSAVSIELAMSGYNVNLGAAKYAFDRLGEE